MEDGPERRIVPESASRCNRRDGRGTRAVGAAAEGDVGGKNCNWLERLAAAHGAPPLAFELDG
jgi:hypothetical protein